MMLKTAVAMLDLFTIGVFLSQKKLEIGNSMYTGLTDGPFIKVNSDQMLIVTITAMFSERSFLSVSFDLYLKGCQYYIFHCQ